MAFSKSFPRTVENSTYPRWEEVYLSAEEEKNVEASSRKENFELMKECIEDAKKIFSEKNLKDFQSDIISVAISLFEKRASHTVFNKEEMAKEKFDETFNKK